MKTAAKELVGEHNFLAFTSHKKAKNPIKEITALTVLETKHEIILTITASAFLINMERYIVGTLIQIGTGQLPKDAMTHALSHPETKNVGHKAAADALTLIRIDY